MLDTWDNISNPKIAVCHSGFSSNFLGGLDCKWRKTTHGAAQLCNWIAYRFVEIEVGFGPHKMTFPLTSILSFWNSGSSYRPVPGRKNSSFHFAVWEAQKAAVSWQGKGGTLRCCSGMGMADCTRLSTRIRIASWAVWCHFEVSQHCNISEKTLEKVCCNSAAFSFKKSLDLNMRTCHTVNVHSRLQWCAGMPHSVGRSIVANSKYYWTGKVCLVHEIIIFSCRTVF